MSGSAALLGLLLAAVPVQENEAPFIRDFLWSADPARRGAARARLEGLQWGDRALSRMQFTRLERLIREGRPIPDADPKETRVLAAGRVHVLVTPPDGYVPGRPHPLLVVLGGGPYPSIRAARSEAERASSLWRRATGRRGWLLAVVADTVSVVEGLGEPRHPLLRPGDVRAAVAAVSAQYRVQPDRICLAGASLGADYALHFAAARPEAWSGVVAISSEGESRERLLRNLAHISLFAINGLEDPRLRKPRAPDLLREILKKFGIRAVSEILPGRGREEFPERYGDILDWLKNGPRNPWPRRLERVPHGGLFPVSRRHYWVETDSAQAAVRAEVRRQEIHLHVARARRIRVRLSDNLATLDRPVTIRLNGRVVFQGDVKRTLKAAVESAAHDPGMIAAAELEFEVPLDAASREQAYAWTTTLHPTIRETHPPSWEVRARLRLSETRPLPDLEGEKLGVVEAADLGFPRGLTGVRLTRVGEGTAEARAGLRAGDILTGFEDEVFFIDGLGAGLIRETFLRLPSVPGSYLLRILRDGQPSQLVVPVR